MRTIVLDTETTGLNPKAGHRLAEIGCVELMHLVPTGKVFHQYVNPERDMPEEAFRIHGLSQEFLRKHPPFREIYQSFLDFIEDAPLVIHNARFDMGFINHELSLLGQDPIDFDRAIDTVLLARQRFPGSPVNLDALCRRFGIDNSNRVKHGALLDSELLAEVYLELMGGRQQDISFMNQHSDNAQSESLVRERVYRPARSLIPLLPYEKEEHEIFLQKIESPLWNRFKAAS